MLLGLLTGPNSWLCATLPHHSYITPVALDARVIFGLIKILNASASFVFLNLVSLNSVTKILWLIQICGAAIPIRLFILIESIRSFIAFFVSGEWITCTVLAFFARIGFPIWIVFLIAILVYSTTKIVLFLHSEFWILNSNYFILSSNNLVWFSSTNALIISSISPVIKTGMLDQDWWMRWSVILSCG